MKHIFIIGCTFALFACHSTPETSQTEIKKDSPTDSVQVETPVIAGKTSILETGANCAHGAAQSIVKKGKFSNTTFELQQNKLTGIETINFENGDKLIIKNWGCDYAALTFRFETSRFQEELNNMGFWYKRAVTLLSEVNKKLNAQVDVVKGTDRLVTQIENDLPNGYQNLKLNEELDFGDERIRNFVSIDKVEKLTDKKFAVEVTFAKGPL